ncbi:MAG TPA: DUF4013 domain-containing protein [Candidatus Dormibacteraeota bacterium]|nr:DUF4013 domain-containing protein [Candidatus Dormibacteraeota bacterium]
MERITDAFVWPFRDPDWLSKVAIMGLILLIPIVGGINGLGWMLAAIHRLRAGEEKLPPANFDYLGLGFRLFVVYLVYYLALAVVGLVLYVPAILILSQQGHDSPNPGLVALGVGLLLLTFSIVTLGSLALTFAMPSIVLAVDHGGIEAGLRVGEIVRRMRASIINTLIAGLMLIAAGLIGQLGSVVCIVGVVFTSAYALAMQAWIIRSYELGSSTPAKT